MPRPGRPDRTGNVLRYRVDRAGFEPATSRLRTERATSLLQRSVEATDRPMPVSWPLRGARPLVGHGHPLPANPYRNRWKYVPSTVQLTQNNSTERIQGTHGRQDS